MFAIYTWNTESFLMLIQFIFFGVEQCLGLHEGKTFAGKGKMSILVYYVVKTNCHAEQKPFLLAKVCFAHRGNKEPTISWSSLALNFVKANIFPPF